MEDDATGCCLCLPSTSVLPSSLTTTPVYDEYGNKALGMNIVSAALILFDYGSDISVAFWLRKEKDSDFFMACTILLIVLPLIVVNLFSLVWYSQVQDIVSALTSSFTISFTTLRCSMKDPVLRQLPRYYTGPPCPPVWVCPSEESLGHMASENPSTCPLRWTWTCGQHTVFNFIVSCTMSSLRHSSLSHINSYSKDHFLQIFIRLSTTSVTPLTLNHFYDINATPH